jgi:AcrR family transcriptional regulator
MLASRRARSEPPREPAPVGLRDRKKEKVRAALIEAALHLFSARGFDGVTVDEIAAAADVSRRTFFRYFATKEAAVLARREEQLEAFREALAAGDAGPPFASIRRALLSLADDYTAKREQILAEQRLIRASAQLVARDLEVDRAFEGVMVEHLIAHSRQGAPDRRRAKIVAAALIGATRVVIEEWAEREGAPDLRRMGEGALDLLEPLAPRARASVALGYLRGQRAPGITYDGLLVTYNVMMGPGMKRNFRNEYRAFKARKAVRESLLAPPPGATSAAPAPSM